MLYLKKANMEDFEKEYFFITNTPLDENGFTNPAFGCSKEDFKNQILPGYINASKGIGLQDGYVPETEFFLWNDDVIVGIFRVRHYLNDFLKNGPGHIGYSIAKSYRGNGYATKGLALTIKEAFKIIKEDEIYMSVQKNNPYSLKVMLNNNAYIHHKDEEEYYTRILASDNE